MSEELGKNDPDGIMKVIYNAAENAAKDDEKAQLLLSLWAQMLWLDINEV